MATNTTNVGRSECRGRLGEMATTPSRRLGAFRRELLPQDDRLLVKSTCHQCGAVIVGSVLDTLAEDEENHIGQCFSGAGFPRLAEQAGQ